MKLVTVLTLIIFLHLGGGTWSKRIMLLPIASPSHVLYFEALGEALHDIYGHEIYMVLPTTYPGISKVSKKLHILTFNVAESDFFVPEMDAKTREDMYSELIDNPESAQIFGRNPPLLIRLIAPWCLAINKDQKMFDSLKNLKMDFAVYDFIWTGICYTILPYRLGVPYGSLGTMLDSSLTMNPHLPSFVPFRHNTIYSEKMTFVERLSNFISLVCWSSMEVNRIPYADDSLVAEYAPEMPRVSLKELFARTLIVLVNSHPLLEGAKPYLPNMIEVGGLTIKPGLTTGKRLPSHFEDIIAEGKLGTILVSFGSLTNALPMELMQKIADALGEFTDYTIIWKYVGEAKPANLTPNIKMMSWIPQNDLLADNRTRLFITHCGNNGQFEGVYHGVPMVAVPLFFDQAPNAARAEYKGYGLYVNTRNFTTDELVDGIRAVLTDAKYRSNIQRASRIFRSQPHPKVRAAYWVNHVMKFGGSHLHSHSIDMPWYEYLMVDIVLFVLALFTIPLAVLLLLVKIK